MTDVLDLDIHALAIEVWPDVARVVKMRFPVGTDLADGWTLTVPHPIGDAYVIDGDIGTSDEDTPRPQVTFTLPADRMRDIVRRRYVIAFDGQPKIAGPIRFAAPQVEAGETTVSVTLVEPQALDVELTVVGGAAGDVAAEDVIVTGPHGIFDPSSLAAAVTEACEQTAVPEDVIPVVIAAILANVDLDELPDDEATLAAIISNAAEVAAHSIVGVTVLGINVTTLSTALANAVYVNSVRPSLSEGADPERSLWVRTVGGLRSFVDFRLFPDGPVDGVKSNGVGGSDPLFVRSFASLGYPFQPAVVIDGALTSDQRTPSTDSDPTPKSGFALYTNGTPLSPGDEGRIEWGHGGIVEGNGELVDYVPTNVAISDEDGDAYLMGVVVGRFDDDADTTDPGNPVSARMRLIRDDLTAPTTIASAALPRLPQKGDRFAFTWDADGHLAGHMNGTEIVSVTETTHDISTFDRIGMPLHQGSDAVDWNDGYYTRVEWFGISDGDEITGNLGTHYWTDDGWQPTGPQARPILTGGSGADGASAYEVAVADGFMGDESAWLASLVGPDGATGAKGDKGDKGDTGNTGPAGDPTTVADGAIPQAKVASLVSDLAAKTPTSRTITAGTGLTGGGTLAADRTLAIDAATLARIGVTVEATSDSSARTSTTATADGTLQFEAAADTTYRVDAYLIFQGDATADLKVGFTIPTGTMHLTVEGGLTNIASGTDYERFLTLTSSAATTVVGIAGASTPISVRISGVIRCSSAGTVALVWAPNGAGAGTGVTRLARSQLHYRAA